MCIHSQLERLKTEGVVDVFQAIKSARIHRPGIIPNTVCGFKDTVTFYKKKHTNAHTSPSFKFISKDHYVFCYEVLAGYVEKMEMYANFKTVIYKLCTLTLLYTITVFLLCNTCHIMLLNNLCVCSVNLMSILQ